MGYEYDESQYAVSAVSGNLTSTTALTLLAALGANQRYLITDIMVTNSNTTTPTLVTIQDEDAVVLWEGYVPAEGGWVKSFKAPLITVANKIVKVKLGTALTTNGVYACIAARKEKIPA